LTPDWRLLADRNLFIGTGLRPGPANLRP